MNLIITKLNQARFAELVSSLPTGSVTESNSVLITNECVIDINEPLIVPQYTSIESVMIRSYGAGGALIRCNVEFPELQYRPSIQLNKGCRLSGLRFKGTNKDSLSHNRIIFGKVCNPIYFNEPDCIVENCEVYNGDKWALWVANPQNQQIESCFIHDTKLSGYGYGIWIGGKSGKWTAETVVGHNILDGCRSAIDGNAGQVNALIYANTFGFNQSYSVLARHGNDGYASGSWDVHDNVILNQTNRSIEFPIMSGGIMSNVIGRNIFIGNVDYPISQNGIEIPSSSMLLDDSYNINDYNGENPHTLQFAFKDNRSAPDFGVELKVYYNKQLIGKFPGGSFDDWRQMYIPIDKAMKHISPTPLFNELKFEVSSVNGTPLSDDYSLWIDNVNIYGNNKAVVNGSFESGTISGWTQSPNGWGTRVVQEEVKDGKWSMRFSALKGKVMNLGSIYQKIK